jgi:hypothetical protein
VATLPRSPAGRKRARKRAGPCGIRPLPPPGRSYRPEA